MTNEEYTQVQAKVMMLTDMIKMLPLSEFIDTGERADTTGPYLNPTLWHEGHAELTKILNAARALKKVQEST